MICISDRETLSLRTDLYIGQGNPVPTNGFVYRTGEPCPYERIIHHLSVDRTRKGEDEFEQRPYTEPRN